MLAALDALFPSLGAAASLLGLAVVLVFVRHGTRGVSLLNVLLVPLLLAFVFLLGKAPLRAASAGWGNAFLYAFMNAAFSAPALMDAGREVRAPVRAALLAAGCIFLCGALILGAIARAGNPGSPMPFLVVAGGNRLFFLAAACAVLTSLAAALFPLLSACERYAGKAKTPQRALCSLRRSCCRVWGFPASSIGCILPSACSGYSFQCSAFLTSIFSRSTTRAYIPAASRHRRKVALITRSSLNTCPP